jgi:hypothetical protein
MDVHKESISIAVRNDSGKLVMEWVIETRANVILDFIHGLLRQSSQQPSTWCGRSEQILLNHVGCEARKSPAGAGVFFLDFSLYRLIRQWRKYP